MAQPLNRLVHAIARSAPAILLAFVLPAAALAQDQGQWQPGVTLRGGLPPSSDEAGPSEPATVTVPANTTVVPRTAGEAAPESNAPAQVNLVALLTVDGQRIDHGLAWRIYQSIPGKKNETKLLMAKSDASPTVSLKPGAYIVNAAFGRADVTRKITVAPGATMNERFVLNAGGLRVKVLVDGAAPAANAVSYDIYSGERDQSDNRTKVVAAVKPDVVIRLQALVLARTGAAPPGWAARPVTMEELVLGYLREPAARVVPEPGLKIVR